jgi:putative ABC transport system ATP-binding protein
VPAPALLELDRVSVVDGDAIILDDVSVVLPDGGVAVVAGASGSGKSTLLRLCNRLEVPASGTVRYRGDDVATLDPLTLRRRVGMVFQRPTPFPGTVRDNLLVARPDLDTAAVEAALERVHLDPSLIDRDVDTLSGGEAQRACLARTVVTEPEVVLMDEPTSALDERATRALERLALELADDGVPIVWVTHDLDQLRRIARHVVVMDRGRVVGSGPAGEVDLSGVSA